MKASIAPLRHAVLARGERLAYFLNHSEAHDEIAGSSRAEELLAQLAKLQGLLDNIVKRGQHTKQLSVLPEYADRDTGLWCLWFRNKRVAALLRLANRKLAKFGWKVDLMVKLSRGTPTIPLCPLNPSRPETTQFLGYMLRDCVEDRSLEQVRRCKVCSHWFMAARIHERNCSKRCRDRCGVRGDKDTWNAYHRLRREMRKTQARLQILTTAKPTPEGRKEIANLNVTYKVLLKEKAKLQKQKGSRDAKK
jgi:hypothetical protein